MSSWKFCPKCGKEHPHCKCYGDDAEQMFACGGQVKKMAGGGGVSADDGDGTSHHGPVTINIGQPTPGSVGQQVANAQNTPPPSQQPGPVGQQVADAKAGMVNPQALPPTMPQDNAQPPQQEQAQVPQEPTAAMVPSAQPDMGVDTSMPKLGSFQDTYKDYLQKHTSEDQAWSNDLANGHITPKTYSDLMWSNKDGSEKSALGKIGTIFGMLLSGAGSGLAHQPNALLSIWDKTISNDIDAQKQSKANAQNYYKLMEQHRMNSLAIDTQKHQNNLTDQQSQQLKVANQAATQALAYRNQSRAQFAAITDMYRKLPDILPNGQPNPQKLDMARMITVLGQHVDQQAMQLNSVAAAADATIKFADHGNEDSSGSLEDNGNESILGKGAQSKFNGMQFNPLSKEDRAAVADQFTKAQQADKVLKNIAPALDAMYENNSTADSLARQIPHIPGLPGNIGELGPKGALGLIQGAQFIMGKGKEENNRQALYESARSKLKGDIIKAMGGNATSSDVADILDANKSDNRDTAETKAKKRQAIESFVIQGTPTSFLNKYKFTKKK